MTNMLWVIVFLEVAMAQNLGTCVFTSNGTVYDFSSLTGTNVQVSSDISTWTYSFFPCENGCQGPTGVAGTLCQQNSQGNPIAIVSIFDSTMTWSTVSFNGFTGVQYTTANGGPPNCAPSDKPRFSTMMFLCQPTGPPSFNITNEPGLQGCPVPPGYVFQYLTPLACPGGASQGCAFDVSSPCMIKSYNEYAWSGGLLLDFNQDSGACGKIFFSDYLLHPQPSDMCINSNTTGSRIVAHMDILAYPKILKMLQDATPQNPVVLFWDDDADSAVIGPLESE